jgi:hypothetical protein
MVIDICGSPIKAQLKHSKLPALCPLVGLFQFEEEQRALKFK